MYAKNIPQKFVVLHIITGLTIGGAENMLYKLLSKTNRSLFEPIVISLMDGGIFSDRIQALGIPVYSIGMSQGKFKLVDIYRLIDKVHTIKPALIQGWMYHANLAAQLASIFTFKPIPVVWNIRHSLYSLNYEKLSTAIAIKVLNGLSRFPKKIVYNSKISAEQHKQLGYRIAKTVVIPNGFDTEIFTPSIESRISIRTELGLTEDTFLIGRICRYDPMKDFPNFLHAAALLLKDYPDVHFILAGTKVDWDNQTLCQLINELGIAKSLHLFGERQDLPRITAALDIASTSSAYGEAFPNVIGEAMSCGVPCVVTDVGDSAWIVGNTGRVVPPKNSQALTNAYKDLLVLGAEGRSALGKAARARVMENFSLDFIVNQYEKLYEKVLVKNSN